MKIAFLIGEFPALSETFILNQITGLIDLGHDVHIYATPPPQVRDWHPDVQTYRLLARTYYAPAIPGRLWVRWLQGLQLLALHFRQAPLVCLRALNAVQYGRDALSLRFFYAAIPFIRQRLPHYDILHCHFGPVGIKGTHLRAIGAVTGRVVTTFHGLDMSQFIQMSGEHAYDGLFAQGDLFLPISRHWQARLLSLGGPAEKIIVHHMGIDERQFCFRPRQVAVGEPIKFVSVARLVEKKGIEYGIRAIATLKAEYPNIQYQIIGGGPLAAALQQLVHELGADDVIEFLGWQEKGTVIATLEQAHILLAPSVTSQSGDQEGIPVALMEAMAMGLVVVSTEHSGIPELIESGVSGVLVPERDVTALVQQLRLLLADPEQWPSLAKAGYRQVQDAFNIDRLNHQLQEIFAQVVQST